MSEKGHSRTCRGYWLLIVFGDQAGCDEHRAHPAHGLGETTTAAGASLVTPTCTRRALIVLMMRTALRSAPAMRDHVS